MDPLLSLASERFISLTTFRRSGVAVSTPVWVGRDGDALVVLTPAGSGKVRRLRHDPRVQIRPCGRFGAVADGAVPVDGIAEIREQEDEVDSRIVLGIERGLERLRRRPATPRLALHITASG
jgi:uncharacterized protein